MVFMRLTALLWLCEGLVQWSAVLVTNVDGRSGLVYLTTPAIIAVVFFGVIDLIAAVGLWLATPWGGVIWLVTAGAQLFVIVIMPGFYEHPVLTGLVAVTLVALYLGLTWQVARGDEAEIRPL